MLFSEMKFEKKSENFEKKTIECAELQKKCSCLVAGHCSFQLFCKSVVKNGNDKGGETFYMQNCKKKCMGKKKCPCTMQNCNRNGALEI